MGIQEGSRMWDSMLGVGLPGHPARGVSMSQGKGKSPATDISGLSGSLSAQSYTKKSDRPTGRSEPWNPQSPTLHSLVTNFLHAGWAQFCWGEVLGTQGCWDLVGEMSINRQMSPKLKQQVSRHSCWYSEDKLWK